jgi:hypothetical protein
MFQHEACNHEHRIFFIRKRLLDPASCLACFVVTEWRSNETNKAFYRPCDLSSAVLVPLSKGNHSGSLRQRTTLNVVAADCSDKLS